MVGLNINCRLTCKWNASVFWGDYNSKIDSPGVGVTEVFPHFPNFSALSKHALAMEYNAYICQVSPQLSCGDMPILNVIQRI